ncbi:MULTISPECIES: SsrA-binding protein SmpB [Zhongshania]|jgi:SsrA-binding protein|uniref:SsrA-binding protein n=2 Tax=Zhongshania TaxID=1434050 RepID=A0A127M2D9_9GAMM|nr:MULTISPECIES: SsrA-binding protein SmpB [Zhongshania]AMO67396.1 SsrA-binding protein [Zhongshania aliphaticivorans]EIF42897.1 SsrA-binding protein [gamma proteobacterium BDW918]MBB5188927.1 SsrA-binding protein [Zhongshania antarctica]|tara:strand:- start:5775 stop:6254 length:480 start_codon:yes stop_codon:yes gene_type:complete
MSKNKSKSPSGTIALNKKSRHDYTLTDKFEAGLVLQGWEVKSLRQGKIQIVDTYVILKDGEAFLLGGNITPLPSASTHFVTDPIRTRKLLLHSKELRKLEEAVQQKGYTCVCTALYWKKHMIKAEIALAKGKQDHDKRETEKNRDWERQKMRIVRDHNT